MCQVYLKMKNFVYFYQKIASRGSILHSLDHSRSLDFVSIFMITHFFFFFWVFGKEQNTKLPTFDMNDYSGHPKYNKSVILTFI